ncbi:MAG: threonine-phosphate decarboxylase [Paracoccaceae bacterium]
MSKPRDHGGGLDAAIARYGGDRAGWLDLSTGINPVPYPTGDISPNCWQTLPDIAAQDRLINAARAFWNIPDTAHIIAAPGASALIAQLPRLLGTPKSAQIVGPTYNEWQAAFENAGWAVSAAPTDPAVRITVHPNNPDGARAQHDMLADPGISIIDESFCDTVPEASLMPNFDGENTIFIKSFGKFWGLAGIRLGFAIAPPALVEKLSDALGPWPVSGPALEIGARALLDENWANQTRLRLEHDTQRLDDLMKSSGAGPGVGTSLFRLYQVDDAQAWQDRLARGHVWSRIFPYSKTWLRLGLPHPDKWGQLEAAL